MVKLKIENEKPEETYIIRLERVGDNIDIVAEKPSTGVTQIIGYINDNKEIHADYSNAFGFKGA